MCLVVREVVRNAMRTYRNKPSCRGLVNKYLPTFCFMTAMEVLEMLEYVREDVEEKNVMQTLCTMRRNGEVVARKCKHLNGFEYRKV